jgi:hypothetical protein
LIPKSADIFKLIDAGIVQGGIPLVNNQEGMEYDQKG